MSRKKNMLEAGTMKRVRRRVKQKMPGLSTNAFQRAMEALKKVQMGHDWYATYFLETWEGAAVDANGLADAVLENARVATDDSLPRKLLLPYSVDTAMICARLMDHMTYEEEERFRAACQNMDAAWQKFGAAYVTRKGAMSEALACFEKTRLEQQQIVADLFFGETMPEISRAFLRAYALMQAALAIVLKEIAQ